MSQAVRQSALQNGGRGEGEKEGGRGRKVGGRDVAEVWGFLWFRWSGRIVGSGVHETAVAWVRHYLKKFPLTKGKGLGAMERELAARLSECKRYINSNLDVGDLCGSYAGRMKELADAKGPTRPQCFWQNSLRHGCRYHLALATASVRLRWRAYALARRSPSWRDHPDAASTAVVDAGLPERLKGRGTRPVSARRYGDVACQRRRARRARRGLETM